MPDKSKAQEIFMYKEHKRFWWGNRKLSSQVHIALTPGETLYSQDIKVGNEYENRKGKYLVQDVNGDKMAITWEDGESIETSKGFQTRIINNMMQALKLNQNRPNIGL